MQKTPPAEAQEVFTHIYKNAVWGKNRHGEGFSGEGSEVTNAKEYMAFLQNFLKEHKIRSVVDAGCGDWEFSQHLDWSGVTYTGFDVVPHVIESNQRKLSSSSIHFVHADFTKMDLPRGDLLICKDVLQHLPHEDVFKFCAQLKMFSHALITNDVDEPTLSSLNLQISARGGYRTIDLTEPPFQIKGFKVLTYRAMTTVKQVLHVSNAHED